MAEYTAIRLIERALREIGEFASGEPLPAEDAQDALEILNDMLQAWGGDDVLFFNHVKETLTLTAHSASRTIGIGGNFNTARPHKLIDGFLTVDGSDIPLDVSMKEHEYNAQVDKTTESEPRRVYYNPTYPLGILYFLPVPDAAYSFTLTSMKPVTELTDLTDILVFPPQYPAAIVSNLALLLCPKYSREPSALTVASASSALGIIKRINAHKIYKPSAIEIAEFNSNLSGNIFTG